MASWFQLTCADNVAARVGSGEISGDAFADGISALQIPVTLDALGVKAAALVQRPSYKRGKTN